MRVDQARIDERSAREGGARGGKNGTFIAILLVCVALSWQGHGAGRASQDENAGVSKVVRAKAFVVVDDAGKERAQFGMSPNEEPRMVVWNKDKTIGGCMEIAQTGMPRFAFEGEQSAPVLELGVGEKRDPVFFMRTTDGKRRLGVGVTETGRVAIGLFDSSTRNRCEIAVDAEGRPRITLRDKEGKARVSVMVDDTGTAALDLLDPTGDTRVVFQVDGDGNAGAAVLGRDGNVVWSSGKQ